MSWLHLQPRPYYLMLMFPISHWLPIAFHCSARLLPSRSTPTQWWWWRKLQLEQIRSKRSASCSWILDSNEQQEDRGRCCVISGVSGKDFLAPANGNLKSHSLFTGREREWNFQTRTGGEQEFEAVFLGIAENGYSPHPSPASLYNV